MMCSRGSRGNYNDAILCSQPFRANQRYAFHVYIKARLSNELDAVNLLKLLCARKKLPSGDDSLNQTHQ